MRKIHATSSSQDRSAVSLASSSARRRSAIEPVIGHLKAEGHLGRCYLKGRAGDAGRILTCLKALLRLFLIAIVRVFIIRSALNPAY
jgi:IS5 family transposase